VPWNNEPSTSRTPVPVSPSPRIFASIAQAGGRDRRSEVLARQIRESAGDRDREYRHFIMTDLYPENEERFPSGESVALS
jgi:hypothetical protein